MDPLSRTYDPDEGFLEEVPIESSDPGPKGNQPQQQRAPSGSPSSPAKTSSSAGGAPSSSSSSSTAAAAAAPSSSASTGSTSVFAVARQSARPGPRDAYEAGSALCADGSRAVEVTVTAPEKVGEGVGSYTTYKVCARVDLSVMKEFKRDRAEVRRRYRDFEWLHTVLKEEHPSSVIPPLPSKAFINKFAPQFIEQRRKHLYKFLHRVAGHPVLARTEEFRMFLMGSLDDNQQDMFENYRIGMTPAPSIGETIYRVFKGAAKSIVNYTKSASAQNPQPAGGVMGDGDSFIVAQNPLGSAAVVNSGSGAGAPVPGGGTGTSSAALALGQDFVAVAKYAADLEANLYAVAEAASAVGFRRAAYARSMQELGRAFETLGRAEYTAELSHVLVEVGKATETFGDMELRGCEKEDSQLVEPLREYIGMARALREMVANGEEAYTTFASVRSELELLAGRRRHAAQDLRRHGTLEGLDGEIEAMRLTREKAHAALAASLKSIEGEVRHFNREKLAEFRLLLQGFLTLNSEQHKRIHTGWVSLTPTLEGILSPPKETALNFNLPPLE